MGISRRENFALHPERQPEDEGRLSDAEAEWAAQWEPTIRCTHAAVQYMKTSAGPCMELEVVIALRPERELRIKFVA
jgi:hypothetical protein